MDNRSCSGYAFDLYELRHEKGVLLRNGRPVRIQKLPLQMLQVLVETPGKVVPREELQQRLWGNTTFVEFDNNLHVAAAKLREALRDSAAKPRFVRTVPGDGYQFICEVTPIYDPEPATETQITSNLSPEMPPVEIQRQEQSVKTESEGIDLSASTATPRRWKLALGIGLALALIAAAGLYGYTSLQRPLISGDDRVLIGHFLNKTNNSSLTDTLTVALRVKLEESPYLNLMPARDLSSIVDGPNDILVQRELRLCTQLGGQVLLDGEIVPKSSGYRLLLRARKCGDDGKGKILTTQNADAASSAVVLSAIDSLSEKMRRRLGESDTSLQKFNIPVSSATSNSIAALRAFTQGEESRLRGKPSEAIGSYKLALDLDPQFALAYSRLGTIYDSNGEQTQGNQYQKKAFELREKTTDPERLYILSHYYFFTGQIEHSTEAYELWHSLYPHAEVPIHNLAVTYLYMGEPDKALKLSQTAVQLDSYPDLAYAMLSQVYFEQGNHAALHALCSDPERTKTPAVVFHVSCVREAMVQHDQAGAEREIQWAQSSPEKGGLLAAVARGLMQQGKVAEARRTYEESVQGERESNLREAAAEIRIDEASFEADLGFSSEARQDALEAMKLVPESPFVQLYAELALVRAGDMTDADKNMEQGMARAPLDVILNYAVAGAIQSTILMKKHDAVAAVKTLQSARPYDFCTPLELAPAYYRGLAYLESGDLHSAALEFQGVLQHRSLVADSPYVPLSQMALGRTLQLTGDSTAAQHNYQEVLALWKDADSSFPPLQQIRRYSAEVISQKHKDPGYVVQPFAATASMVSR